MLTPLKKSYDQASILKNRDITLPTKVHLVKAMVFLVVTYGCESCTTKKVKCWRIDAFELWYWRRLLRVPLTARRSNQPILKSTLNIHWKDWCWSWSYNTLATWCEELTHLKRPWCWERLKVGGEGDDRGWDGWTASLTQWTWIWVNSRSWWWTGRPGVLQSIGLQRVGQDWASKLNWTELMVFLVVIYGCESWTVKKAENRRTDAFGLWCWRRPLDCKEIKPFSPKCDLQYSLEGLMMKMKLQ